jgi:hypothetical protein
MMPWALVSCRKGRPKGRVCDVDGWIIESSGLIWAERVHLAVLILGPGTSWGVGQPRKRDSHENVSQFHDANE